MLLVSFSIVKVSIVFVLSRRLRRCHIHHFAYENSQADSGSRAIEAKGGR
jgi:hypothetical protein